MCDAATERLPRDRTGLPLNKAKHGHASTHSGVSPEGAPGTLLARRSWRAWVLTEVVVPTDGHSAEVAHLGTAAAGHAVAALGLDEAGPTLVAFSNAGGGHSLLSERRKQDWR